MKIQHGKIVTVASFYDGQMTSSRQQAEVSLFTNRDKLVLDVIDALSVITGGDTKKLEIEVCVDAKNRMRIVKKWSLKGE